MLFLSTIPLYKNEEKFQLLCKIVFKTSNACLLIRNKTISQSLKDLNCRAHVHVALQKKKRKNELD